MSRAAGLCKYCGGPKRGRAARTASPIARCPICESDICPKHAVWASDFYICYKCDREGKQVA